MLTKEEADILAHTSSNGRYVSTEALAIDLGKRGLLFDHGPQALAAGAHYLTRTAAGRAALNEWRTAQPKPPKPHRRPQSPVFAAWRACTEAGGRIPFATFRLKIWPHHRSRFV